MRILQVRFKNLNSLVGEWQIDFTEPSFIADGIFAITGPTGSGKSTIFDAICLALYGRTPRLNKVTKGENEIMSRQTGECFSEVTFETRKGRYRCHWSQHRARRRAGGELQPQKHEISNADSDEILESNIRSVAELIEQVTGMDFDRFTRSMLLAQGNFAAFLQAAPDERSPILEHITGTEIYSQISIRVHEITREVQNELERLQNEGALIVIMEPEEEQQVLQQLESGLKKEVDLKAHVDETNKAIAWLTTIDDLTKQIAAFVEEEKVLQAGIDAFKLDRTRLNRAMSAATLDGTYATLIATRKQQADDKAELKTHKESLPQLESSAKKYSDALTSAEQRTMHARNELETEKLILKKVRAIDQKIFDRKKDVTECKTECDKYSEKIISDNRKRLEEIGKQSAAQTALDLVEHYLQENARDEWLISGLAGVEEQVNDLASKQSDIAKRKTALVAEESKLELAKTNLSNSQQVLKSRTQELEDASQQVNQSKKTLAQLLGGRLLREYRSEKESLLREKTFRLTIASLEEHRTKLEDGKPCPLCGATNHPYAEGNIPVLDEIEQTIKSLESVITKAEKLEDTIKEQDNKVALASTAVTNAEKAELAAENTKKMVERAIDDATSNLTNLQNGFEELLQSVVIKLQPLGITELAEEDIGSLTTSLTTRRDEWQAKIKEKTKVVERIASNTGEISRLDAIIQVNGDILAEQKVRLKALEENLAASMEERRELYGDKVADDEEQRLTNAIDDAAEAEKLARKQHDEHKGKLTAAQSSIKSLNDRIDQRDPTLRTLETEFIEALATTGFENEEDLVCAQLSPQIRAELTANAKDLDDRQAELRTKQKDRKTQLATEQERNITDKTSEELETQQREQEDELKDIGSTIARIKFQLEENNKAKERVSEKTKAIKAQQEEYRRWKNLWELVGSSDGKKYRNYAQGLTFEIMVGHANRQLQKMSDRYLLIRDDKQPLDLNVVDSYQAGEIRSTKNLSGGESFIVSLALALGLSQMSSRNVQVDSLFLDEGFGVLDEEILDTALESLAGLQQEGKLIGIISHVPALKERISTQIVVTPQTGGKSKINGPGCSRLNP